MITLRPYQMDGLNAIWQYFAAGNTGNPLLAWPTGVGKSVVPAEFIKETMKVWPNQRFLMITHVKELIQQNAEVMRYVWPEAPLGIYSAGLGHKQSAFPIVFGGIQSMIKHPSMFGHRDMIFIDEAHLVSQDDSSQYLSFIATMRLINPALRVVGMTATPFRMGQGLITDEGLFTDIVHDLTSCEAFNQMIADGWLCPLVPRRTRTELDVSNVSINKGDFIGSQLQHAVDKNEVTFAGLRELTEYAKDRRSWLIFASGIDHSEHIAEMLQSFGVECAPVHSKRAKDYNDAAIRAFKNNELRSIVSYSKLTTGFNHNDIDCIADFRPTMSIPLHCLDDKTEILTNAGFKNMTTLTEKDIVSSVNSKTLEHEYVEIECLLKRYTSEDEFFVSFKSPQLDWRVTNEHRILMKQRYGRNRISTSPFFELAKYLPYKERVELPTSAKGHNNDLPIADSDLRFIGLVMTDGCLAKDGSAIIYQSERYPEVLEEIRKCISESGMKYSEYIGKPRPPYFTMHRFQIARGMPRKTQLHLTGWGFLEPYLTKDFALSLMNLSERQFDILIEAIHWGDGSKQPKNVDWIKRSYTITTGNKIFAERLQHTAIVNGWRCNLRVVPNTNVMLLHLKKQSWNVIQKSNDNRSEITLEEVNWPEMVWCIQNKNGTIITRRNGKVLILGNCQKLGRGTRPAHGKSNCLVLDYARNVPRLGPVNDPIIPRKKGSKEGDIPVKLCEACGTYNHLKVRFCTNCGHEFQFQVKIVPKSGNDEILRSDQPIIEMYQVHKAIYQKKQKEGKPPYIKAIYYCGVHAFNEFIFPEATKPFMKHLYHKWWMQRHASPPPVTTDDALKYHSELRIPKRITVHVNKEFPEIKSVEF